MTNRFFALVAGLCLALAGGSLALGHEPVYDAWAWLIWGRELGALELDLTAGPSWKPLPVAITTALSAAGESAPELWTVLVRAAWLLALALAALLAHRLAPPSAGPRARAAGAAFAALSLALLHDPVAHWARQGFAGMSEPLLVALVLGAALAALDGRARTALLLGGLAALVRPEAFPLLLAYALWRWRPEPATRPLVVALALAIPALWLVPDLLASGNALGGAQRAQRGTGGVGETLGWALALPLALAWPLALAAVADRRDPRVRAIGGAALAWIAIVAAMVLAGFPGLPRFNAPAAALVGVLGGAGLARLLCRPAAPAPASRPAFIAVLAAAALVTLVQLPGRVAELPHAITTTREIADSHDDLRALTRELGGPAALLRCGRLATGDTLVRPALAWEFDVPLAQVVSFGRPPRLSGAFVVGPQARPTFRFAPRVHGRLLGRRGEWSVYSVGCPASERSAGVSGAQR